MRNIQFHQLEEDRSSVVSALAYDRMTVALYVEFKKNGAVWQYKGVGQGLFEELLGAISVGSCFAKSVKPQFEGRKVDATLWASVVARGTALAGERRAEAYEKANRALYKQLRKNPKAIAF